MRSLEPKRADMTRSGFRQLWGPLTVSGLTASGARSERPACSRPAGTTSSTTAGCTPSGARGRATRERGPEADLLLYHLRMIRKQDREARVERDLRIDPDHVWQDIGYDYLLDERGMELSPLEPGAITCRSGVSGR